MATEDEMVGWPHWLNGHEFEQTHGDSEGQGSLTYYSPWGRKESDTTERLNNNNITLQIAGNGAEKAVQCGDNLHFAFLYDHPLPSTSVWPNWELNFHLSHRNNECYELVLC